MEIGNFRRGLSCCWPSGLLRSSAVTSPKARRHRELSYFATTILAGFEIPDDPGYLAIGPISHVTGTKVLPVLMKGGTVHMLRAFDPDASRSPAKEPISRCYRECLCGHSTDTHLI